MSDGPEQLELGRAPQIDAGPVEYAEQVRQAIGRMRETTHDDDVSTLIARAHELGRGHGHAAGLAEGYEIAREHLIDRVALQLEQRSGSPRDVGGSVLREAIRRMQASRKDIDPTHH